MLVLSLAPSLGKRQRWLILVHWSISATTETDFQGGIVDNLSCCPPLENQRRAMTGRAAILDATERPKEVAVQYIHDDPTLCHARHGVGDRLCAEPPSSSRAPSPCYFLLDHV